MKTQKLKSFLFGVIILLSVATFSACDSNEKSGLTNVKSDSASENSDFLSENPDPTSEPKYSAPPYDDNASNSKDNWHSDNESINWVRENFNVTLPVVTAAEALDMVKLSLPTQIDGCSVFWEKLLDEETFLVELLEKGEWGLYNMTSNEYSSLPGIGYGEICEYNRDYIVYKWYDGDFTQPSDDDSVELYLYDIPAQTNNLIYKYSFDRYYELDAHWHNSIALSDNIIYFDDISEGDDGELHAYLYSYDIRSGKTEKIVDDAQNPFIFNGDIVYLKLKDGMYRHISSLSGKYDLDINGHVSFFAALPDSIYSLGVASNDDEKRETTWGIKDLNTEEYILMTTRTISDLYYGNTFFAFIDFGQNGFPIVYNAQDGNIVVFEEFYDTEVSWRFYKDIGVIRTLGDKSDMYMFKLK